MCSSRSSSFKASQVIPDYCLQWQSTINQGLPHACISYPTTRSLAKLWLTDTTHPSITTVATNICCALNSRNFLCCFVSSVVAVGLEQQLWLWATIIWLVAARLLHHGLHSICYTNLRQLLRRLANIRRGSRRLLGVIHCTAVGTCTEAYIGAVFWHLDWFVDKGSDNIKHKFVAVGMSQVNFCMADPLGRVGLGPS